MLPRFIRRSIDWIVFRVRPVGLIAGLLVADLTIFSNINTPDATGRQRLFMLGYALVGHSVLLLRWKTPERVYLLVWAHAICAALLSKAGVFFYLPIFGPLAALHAVAVCAPLRRVRVALVAASAATGLWVWKEVEDIEADRYLSALIGVWLFYQALIVGVWYLGQWRRRKEAAAMEKATMAEERRRIGLELHDIVGSAVTIMTLEAAGAQQVLDRSPERAEEAFKIIEARGLAAMAELRRMQSLMEHDQPTIAWPPSNGLADLDSLLGIAEGSGLSIRKEIIGKPTQLDESVDLTAYRFVNEAITNSIKHAGPGTCATVRLTWAEDLEIEVVDDGGGTPVKGLAKKVSTGRGLLGLREQVKVVGGDLQSGKHGKGFRVAMSIPLNAGPTDLPPRQRLPTATPPRHPSKPREPS